MIYTTYYNSPIGELLLASDENSLVGLWMVGQKYFCRTILKEGMKQKDTPILIQTKKWLERYFAKEKPDSSELPLAPKGSEFQQAVWQVLREIPFGRTMTYGEIGKQVAKQMGKESMSAQAVGGAVGHNPISIIIPCHRVVGSNGSLTGFAGGLAKKITLLELENVDLSNYFLPVVGRAL